MEANGIDFEKLRGLIKDELLYPLKETCDRHEINTSLRISHFLSQMAYESENFTITSENLNFSNDELKLKFPIYFTDDVIVGYYTPERIANRIYSNLNGNGDEKSGDGWKYRGRGFFQIKGKDNYVKLSNDIRVKNILDNPDIISESKYAMLSAGWYWQNHNLNTIADQGLNANVITNITKIITGGISGLDNRFAELNKFYAAITGTGKPNSENKKSNFIKIKIGSSGPRVTELQNSLKQIGVFSSEIDGVMGAKTLTAVHTFQNSHEMPITSEVDENTFMKIIQAANERETEINSVSEIALKYFNSINSYIEFENEWWNEAIKWINGDYGKVIDDSISAANSLLEVPMPYDSITDKKKSVDLFIGKLKSVIRITEEVDESTIMPPINKSNRKQNNEIRSIAQTAYDKFDLPQEVEPENSNINQSDVEPKKIPAEKINAIQSIAEQFTPAFENLISKYPGWYKNPIDNNENGLSALLIAASEYANRIIKNKETYFANKLADGTDFLILLDLRIFIRSIKDFVLKCEELVKYYKLNLKDLELITNLQWLNTFRNTAQRFIDELQLILHAIENETPLPSESGSVPDEANIAASTTFDKETLTALNSDVPYADTPDSLGITPDVNALASVIAYKYLKTPLAIGLFGNWGSGKSFFMKKLQKQIDLFAADDGDDFVERVVHIEFNSWHYSESNLWASFVTKIFEELDNYGNKNPGAVKELFKKLNSSSEFLTDANTKLQAIGATIIALNNELTTKKVEVAEKAKELNGIKLADVALEVFNNPDIKNDLEEIKNKLPQKEINNLEDIYRSVNELNGFVNKFIETLKLFTSFRSNKSWFALILFTIICTSPFWLFYFFNIKINDFFNWFGKYSTPVALILANLSGVAAYATIGLNKVQEKLKSISGTCAVLEKQSLAQQQVEIDKIQFELDIQKQAQIQKESEINALIREQAEIQASIDDIQSGKKLANFISGRVTDQRYINSLGLVTWIRKDFKKLDEILKEQRLVNNLKKKSKEEKEKIFQVDRIVLYIDDLDRCKEDIVVCVLEAIHLLLTFELFVVVVGVDPRWMHNALNNKYNKQLKTGNAEKVNVEVNAETNSTNKATSYDYLEKIFQVPFVLNEIDREGKVSLIDALTKTQEISVQAIDSDVSQASTEEITNRESDEIKNELTNGDIKDAETTINEDNKTEEEEINQQEAEKRIKDEADKKQKEAELTKAGADKKQKEANMKKAKEQLVISVEEINFMKGISELIGNSPRTINRYINIYRIIRSHSSLVKTEIPIQDYCAVMILLAIITGLPNESKEFFKSFAEEKTGTFKDFVTKSGTDFQLLKDACGVSFSISESSQKTVGEMTIDFMKERFELVQRFSFRNYADNVKTD